MGLNGTRWQWRMMKWEKSWSDFKSRLGEDRKRIEYQHKFCNECNALIDRDTKVCPHCDAKASSHRVQVASRAVNALAPSWFLSVTHWVLIVNVMIGLFTLLPTQEGNRFYFISAMLLEHGLFRADFCVRESHWWRMVTYGYLHGNLLHIGFNMLALVQLGPLIENGIGRRRFFVLYSFCLVVAVVPKLLFGQLVGTVGASGAIFGLIGFGVTYAHVQGMGQWRNVFLNWAAMGLVFGFVVPNIDNLAHGGGLICGLLMGLVLGKEGLARGEELRRRLDPIWLGLSWLFLAATVWAFYVWFHETYLSLRVLDLVG